MVKGRRAVQRPTSIKSLPCPHPAQTVRRHTPKVDEVPSIPTAPPKHLALPPSPAIPELGFEFIVMLFSTVTLGLSYLNLYRTVFWLPQSYTKYAMHFHLMDKGLICFILMVLARRLLWCLMKSMVVSICPQQYWAMSLKVSRTIFMMIFSTVLVFSLYKMTSGFSVLRIASLLYPFAFYLCIYRFDATSFLEVIPTPIYEEEKAKHARQGNFVRPIGHVCSNSAETIRSEVKFLRENFNQRIALVIFHTVVGMHYTTLVPCLFAPNALFYDNYWIKVQMLLVSITFFAWHLVFCFPARYCDTIHRAALHLGSWSKLDSRSNNTPFNTWSQSVVWPQGSHVKYLKEFYRAEGISNAAEPGNASHIRLYKVFADPSYGQLILVCLSSLLVTGEFGYVASLVHWQQLLGSGFVLGASYASYFIIIRDYIVMNKVYQTEKQQQAKVNS